MSLYSVTSSLVTKGRPFIIRRYVSNKASRSVGGNSSIFGDIFSSLRLKATDALTSSLSNDEKDELLNRLNPPVSNKVEEKEKDDLQIQKSIAEAVAIARAIEVKRHEEKWNKQEQVIRESAERAVRDRVENELKIQKQRIEFEKWEAARLQAIDVDSEEQEAGEEREVEVKEAAVEEHPVLGPAIVDLCHKRIHVVSAATLATIPIWKKQRIYRHDRAKGMANDKMKSLHLGMPGIIALHEDEDGKLTVIDGQHRVGMMTILQEKNASHEDFNLDKILVEVYVEKKHGKNHAQDLFLEVNKAEPVKLVDMPGVAQGSVRKIISSGAERLAERYPDMFKPSQRCRPPHLNIDNLRDALFASNVLNRHELKSGTALETWMIEQNTDLGKRFEKEEERSAVSKQALAKAEKFQFFLGLHSEWMYK